MPPSSFFSSVLVMCLKGFFAFSKFPFRFLFGGFLGLKGFGVLYILHLGFGVLDWPLLLRPGCSNCSYKTSNRHLSKCPNKVNLLEQMGSAPQIIR
jgi:hypothetical protein